MSHAGPALELAPLDRSSRERSRVTPANIRDISDPGFRDFNHDLCCQVVFSKAPEPSSTHPIKRRLWTTARFWFSILPESTRERVLHSRYAGNPRHGNAFLVDVHETHATATFLQPIPHRVVFPAALLFGNASWCPALVSHRNNQFWRLRHYPRIFNVSLMTDLECNAWNCFVTCVIFKC